MVDMQQKPDTTQTQPKAQMPRIPLWLYIVIWVAILAILVVVGLAMGASVETVVVGIVTAAVVFGVCAVMTKKAGPRA